jgi:hypothetical protein
MKKLDIFLIIGIMILIAIVVALVGGIIFTFLWNLVIPVAFNGPTLSLIEGTALMLLIQLVLAPLSVSVKTR